MTSKTSWNATPVHEFVRWRERESFMDAIEIVSAITTHVYKGSFDATTEYLKKTGMSTSCFDSDDPVVCHDEKIAKALELQGVKTVGDLHRVGRLAFVNAKGLGIVKLELLYQLAVQYGVPANWFIR